MSAPAPSLLAGHDAAWASLGRAAAVAARAALAGEAAPAPPATEGPLAGRHAAFVALRDADGAVLGSIGTTAPEAPLATLIPELARAAVLGDPRQPPVAADTPGLALEVVLAGPLRPLPSPEALRVGLEGVRIRQGLHSAVLLPSVARERGWDADTFLTYACRMAGLAGGSFRRYDTEVAVFEVRELRLPLTDG